MTPFIRDAERHDAAAACDVMRRSITELCVADHKNDPAILGPWLRNKTPASFSSWILQPGMSLLVALDHDTVIAVGAITHSGQILLNYVSPDARFRGVSKTLLTALEARAIEQGCTVCTLNSTETARRFYLANGYTDVGPSAQRAGMNSGCPMSKLLAVASKPQSARSDGEHTANYGYPTGFAPPASDEPSEQP